MVDNKRIKKINDQESKKNSNIRPHICHLYHLLYMWRKNFHVENFQLSMYDDCREIKKILYMWRNFRCLPMTDVEKSEILHIWHVCDVENVAIYAKFMLFS